MIRAWRLGEVDGEVRYALIVGALSGWLEGQELARRAGIDAMSGQWVVPEEGLERHKAEKVFGVITGPSSCGCEEPGFRWVTEGEVESGRTAAMDCTRCPGGEDILDEDGVLLGYTEEARHQCDIIDVCGEADVAREVYDAEFKAGIEALA